MLKHLLLYLHTHRTQLIKFIFFGFLTFAINIVCFHAFYGGLVKFNYPLAVTLAYIITVMAHFLLHRTFTYQAVDQQAVHHVWRYTLMLILNYLVTLFVVWFAVNILKISAYWGIVMATGCSAGISFFVMKYFVFDVKEKVYF